MISSTLRRMACDRWPKLPPGAICQWKRIAQTPVDCGALSADKRPRVNGTCASWTNQPGADGDARKMESNVVATASCQSAHSGC